MESSEGKAAGRPSPAAVSTKQARIAKVAQEIGGGALTSLSHHIDVAWLREAYRRTRKDGAPGVDGVEALAYAQDLEKNLQRLLDRAKDGDAYRAPPVRRVYIPKAGRRETRPIGIPTVEDKVLQRAVVMALEPVYEQDFKESSYGFRPGRSAHHALADLWKTLMEEGPCTVLEVDVRQFFDTVDKGKLQAIVRQRIRDGVILRLIGKWLNAGVMEERRVWTPERGTPQGGVVSPLLSNIYLHHVLDVWFEDEVVPRLRGRAKLYRYCDDFVIVFRYRDDARRVQAVLAKRFEKYGLELHPEKTRLVTFRPTRSQHGDGKADTPRSFDFLGFTHVWGLSRKGRWVVRQHTAKDRFRRSVQGVWQWCRQHRHEKVGAQYARLRQKVVGHYHYFGLTGNMRALSRFRHEVIAAWRYWLNRRSQNRHCSWERMQQIQRRYMLPWPRIMHSTIS